MTLNKKSAMITFKTVLKNLRIKSSGYSMSHLEMLPKISSKDYLTKENPKQGRW